MQNCKQCGKEYSRIRQHWSASNECTHPKLSKQQKDIIVGLLMGDGSLSERDGRNPQLSCSMVTEEYLSYLSEDIFPKVSGSVFFYRTGEENAAKSNLKSVNAENCKDIYRWTLSHPELEKFTSWYSTGEKVFPNNIELTPTVLKHWYCGDGSFHNYGNRFGAIQISLSNERRNKNKIEDMFLSAGFTISNWSEHERESGGYYCRIEFSSEESKNMFQYMGDAPPGFEYKWPNQKT